MTTEFGLVLLVIAVAYTVKGVSGMGGPLLAVPFIASLTSVEYAVVVLSLANMVSNGWLLWEHRAGARGTGFVMIPFLAVGTIAVIAGTWLLTEIDDRILSVVIAVVIAAYIWRYFADPAFGLERATARRIAAPMGDPCDPGGFHSRANDSGRMGDLACCRGDSRRHTDWQAHQPEDIRASRPLLARIRRASPAVVRPQLRLRPTDDLKIRSPAISPGTIQELTERVPGARQPNFPASGGRPPTCRWFARSALRAKCEGCRR
jgi:hypothetical protein